jgi:hypothetical protein
LTLPKAKRQSLDRRIINDYSQRIHCSRSDSLVKAEQPIARKEIYGPNSSQQKQRILQRQKAQQRNLYQIRPILPNVLSNTHQMTSKIKILKPNEGAF